MDTTTWTLGVLAAGVENVQHGANGTAGTRAGAVEAASDALVVAAMERGREQYRISVADTQFVIRPGLTEDGDIDLMDLAYVLKDAEQFST
jgi:hypothetical protein